LSSGRLPYRELQQLYEETQERLRRVCNEKDEISLLAQQRQEAFLRSEEKYKDDMRLLEVRLQTLGAEDRSRMEPLRNLHGNIQDTILSIQNKTARVLQDQERDLIRAFRARLADVTVELENERRRAESGSAEWVARCRKLTEELEFLRDLTDKLTSENKSVLKDNRRFKRQMKTQEEDREFLIRQLVSVKKENARLRYSFDQLAAGTGAAAQIGPDQQQQQQLGATVSSITGQPFSSSRPALRAGTPVTDSAGNRPSTATPFGGAQRSSRPQSAFAGGGSTRGSTASGSRPGTAALNVNYASTGSLGSALNGHGQTMDEDKESRYKSMLSKLQRQVEDGQKALRSLRTAHTAELASRNELQTFLRRCIDDVRQDMAERGRSATLRRAASASRSRSSNGRNSMPPPPLDPRQIPLAEFTPQDRINVMEWLLSQDQVIFMLYERMFPQAAAHPGATAAAAAQQQQDFGNESGQIEAGAPGSLFYAPQQWSRPASSPGQKAGYVSSIHSSSSQQRPQTVGPGSTRAGGALPSVPASSGPSTGSSARLAGQPQSQYEKPSRPLSGFDAMRSGGALQTVAGGGGGESARAKRPHTAHPTSSSSQRASSSAQQQQQQHQQHSGVQGLTAEERAEDEYQRQQRALETGGGGADVRDEDEDDDDADNELAADDGSRRGGAGLGELDPLSDDEDDDGDEDAHA
jgi:hypothetical protein